MAWNQNKWQKPQNNPVEKKTMSGVWKGAIAALVVIVGAVGAWLALSPAPAPATAQTAEKKKVKKPAPKPMPKKEAKAPAKVVPKGNEGKEEVPPPPPPEYVKKPGQLQLPNGKILTFPPPAEGQTRKVYAYGHLYECDHLGNFKDISKRPLFKTAFEENFLALASESKPFIPAFLTGLDPADVAKMLAKNYEPKGDETDEEKERLKAYDQMRTAALEYIAQGGTFDDFVGNIATFVKKERQTRANCLREVMTLYKQGKVAEAKEMANAAKILTDREGYKAIRLPPHVQKAFDEVQ